MIQLNYSKWYRFKNGIMSSGFKAMPIAELGDFYCVKFDDSTMPDSWVDKNTGQLVGASWWIDIEEQLELPLGENTCAVSCTCGGLKTYNNYAKEFHSTWCDLFNVRSMDASIQRSYKEDWYF
jgi:hypothetical protein